MNTSSDFRGRARAVGFFGLTALAALSTSGCGSKLASPFDAMKTSTVTVLRLQNYEPPAAQATGVAAQATTAIPAQIQQWITAGAAMLPPGLLPPGLVPGAQPAAPVAATVPRFHNFPILGSVQITDAKTQEEVLDILGHDSNFSNSGANCMYAEFGIAISQGNAPPAEILVSLSCGQVQPFQMSWPYTKVGLPPETAKRIVAVMQKSFGG